VGDIYILADGSKAWLFNILVDRTKWLIRISL
jgi:hypothetical protein